MYASDAASLYATMDATNASQLHAADDATNANANLSELSWYKNGRATFIYADVS